MYHSFTVIQMRFRSTWFAAARLGSGRVSAGRPSPPGPLLLFRAVMLGATICVAPVVGRADDPDGDASRTFFSCRRRFASAAEFATDPATLDLYNGLTWIGGAAGISLGGSPTRRWSSVNGLDSGVRDALRLDHRSSRESADLASHLFLAVNTVVIPVVAIGVHHYETGDCVEDWDMATDAVESFGLTLLVTEALKLATGRERPFGDDCDANPPKDARCGSQDRYSSFVSGHVSLAAAAAGVGCAYSIRREVFGSTALAQATPCALGTAAAITTGILRVASDRHWGSDVLVGFGLGAMVGYFDTWGPFDLLRFETRDDGGRVSSRGMVLPEAGAGTIGARLTIAY